jgi:hypothetical protein
VPPFGTSFFITITARRRCFWLSRKAGERVALRQQSCRPTRHQPTRVECKQRKLCQLAESASRQCSSSRCLIVLCHLHLSLMARCIAMTPSSNRLSSSCNLLDPFGFPKGFARRSLSLESESSTHKAEEKKLFPNSQPRYETTSETKSISTHRFVSKSKICLLLQINHHMIACVCGCRVSPEPAQTTNEAKNLPSHQLVNFNMCSCQGDARRSFKPSQGDGDGSSCGFVDLIKSETRETIFFPSAARCAA